MPVPPPFDAWSQPRAADGSYVAIAREALASLTSLRFFAAGYVVLHHLVNMGLLATQGADADRSATWYLSWATQGHIGVTFFFVLSGFILAWCYHGTFGRDRTDGVTARAARRRFWFARFARVWPLHAAVFLVFVPLALLDAGLDVRGLFHTAWTGALNLSLLHAWVPWGGPDGISDTFNAPSWTLSCELLFYVAFPALATWLVARARWGIAQLSLFAAAAWLALGGLGFALADAERADWIMRVLPATRIADFVVGVCAGLAVVQLRQWRTLGTRPPAPADPARAWTALEGGLVIAAACSPLLWAEAVRGTLPATLGTSWFHLPVLTALIVVFAMERGSISRRVFAHPALVWLGEVSYALYLTHMLFVLGAYRAGMYDRLGWFATSLLVATVAIVVSGIVHKRFERPVRARLTSR